VWDVDVGRILTVSYTDVPNLEESTERPSTSTGLEEPGQVCIRRTRRAPKSIYPPQLHVVHRRQTMCARPHVMYLTRKEKSN
jgi:hypothetical protein